MIFLCIIVGIICALVISYFSFCAGMRHQEEIHRKVELRRWKNFSNGPSKSDLTYPFIK